jgi:hypothetical protein
MSEEKAIALEKALKNEGHLKETSLKARLKTFAKKFGEAGAAATGSEAMSGFFRLVSSWLPSGKGLLEIGEILSFGK